MWEMDKLQDDMEPLIVWPAELSNESECDSDYASMSTNMSRVEPMIFS